MKNARLGALLAIALSTTNCTTLQNQSRVDPQTVAVFPDELECASPRIKGDTNIGALQIHCIKDEDGTELFKNAHTDRLARNALADRLVIQSNRICTVELGRLTGNEAIVNTILSSATTGLSAISSIVTGDWASILAAGANITNGTRDHFRAEVYRKFVTEQLTKVIAAARAEKLQTITSHDAQDPSQYGVTRMIREVDEYHQICSFQVALSLVEKAVERGVATTSQRVDELTAAINELEIRIAALDSQLARANLSDAQKKGLGDQREALRAEQTELYKQRAHLRTNGASTTPAPTPTPTPTATPTPTTTPTPAEDQED